MRNESIGRQVALSKGLSQKRASERASTRTGGFCGQIGVQKSAHIQPNIEAARQRAKRARARPTAAPFGAVGEPAEGRRIFELAKFQKRLFMVAALVCVVCARARENRPLGHCAPQCWRSVSVYGHVFVCVCLERRPSSLVVGRLGAQ